jgi:hypothetical protein
MNESAEQWNKSGRKAIRERNYRQRSSLLKATPHQSAQRASIRRHPHICASCDNDPLDEPGPGGGGGGILVLVSGSGFRPFRSILTRAALHVLSRDACQIQLKIQGDESGLPSCQTPPNRVSELGPTGGYRTSCEASLSNGHSQNHRRVQERGAIARAP